MAEAGVAGPQLRHLALFYTDPGEYLSEVADFLRAGTEAGECTFAAVPGDAQAKLRRLLGGSHSSTKFADMTELGRNPGRIMPAIQEFASSCQQPVRFVGEPIWPGRSAAEVREATRHEALINLAFSGTAGTILCPYDTLRLPASVIADACRTHPLLSRSGREEASADYDGTGVLPADCDSPLPPSPPTARTLGYESDLREVRRMIADQADGAGLPPARIVDLVLAVSEVAANTLRHTKAGGSAGIWRAADELVCEVRDSGRITDPLAGRRLPDHDRPGGHGLWLVNQVCDLVELRTSRSGTVVRIHMRLSAGSSEPAWHLVG
jgi:anti-sigma regulatory factor (Ser/Thr protein kinase)